MRIVVRLFAGARERAGRDRVEVELSEPATVEALRAALVQRVPKLAPILKNAWIAVGDDYARDDATIAPDADVAVIPPVSGGSR